MSVGMIGQMVVVEGEGGFEVLLAEGKDEVCEMLLSLAEGGQGGWESEGDSEEALHVSFPPGVC